MMRKDRSPNFFIELVNARMDKLEEDLYDPDMEIEDCILHCRKTLLEVVKFLTNGGIVDPPNRPRYEKYIKIIQDQVEEMSGKTLEMENL